MDLPNDLRLALDEALRGVPLASLRQAAEALSQRYRAGHSVSQERYVKRPADALAYAAYRLPATFAALSAAAQAAARQLPEWQPRTLLDVGAGLGAAAWAAATVWPSLEGATLVEREPAMIAVGRQLSARAQAPALRGAVWQSADLLRGWQPAPHDLVTAGYLLGELPPAALAELVDRLWDATRGVLLIVEPGTPRGFGLISLVRERLRAEGAALVAPCPHAGACPLAAADWCHFAQRISRTRMQRSVKQAELAYEDEKFSYVAFSRLPANAAAARVIRHPQSRPGVVTLELCTPAGLQQVVVPRHQRSAFRAAREARWGDQAAAEILGDEKDQT